MNGTDLKKIITALFAVSLVFIALQGVKVVSHHELFSRLSLTAPSTRFLPTPNFVEMDDVLLQPPIEICTQSYPQRNDFKKTVSLIGHTLFQASSYSISDFDFILKKGVLPSTPLYISYCNMLI